MKRRIFIAGGGTGGHIYPGLAIAQELQKADPEIEIHFVGTRHGLESKIIPSNGFPLHYISVGGLKNVIWYKKLFIFFKFPIVFFQCLYLLIKYKPQFVFGVGGYSSGPFVLTAAIIGKKTALFESNAQPGITNRILSYFVGTSFTLFEESQKYLKSKEVILSGFPVRGQMTLSPKRKNSNLHVLIFGGSQGARGINITASEMIRKFSDQLQDVEFVHQTGRLDFLTYQKLYQDAKNVECREYLDPIKQYYDWADLVICRAGASTISELSACGKAAIFIPFPFAADNHQQKNAESLESIGAAEMILQKNFTSDLFFKKIQEFKSNKEKILELELQIHKRYKANAAKTIVEKILTT